MIIGAGLLYRVHKKRYMIASDSGTPAGYGGLQNEEESESLLAPEASPIYKGGIGAQILHMPLSYKDSTVVPAEWNPTINLYIKQAEYSMSVVKVLSGGLTLLLEKHNFEHLDDHYKVPIYMIIGSSLSFLVVYTLFDFIEIAKQYYDSCMRMLRTSDSNSQSVARPSRPAITSNLLYLLMICMACFFGGGLGIVYGITDVEGLFTVSMYMVYRETLLEIISLAPVGLLIGLAFGFFFGVLRAYELHFAGDLVPQTQAEAAGAKYLPTAGSTTATLMNYDDSDDSGSDEESRQILI